MPNWLHVSNVINDFWKISQQIPLELFCLKRNLEILVELKQSTNYIFFFLHFNSLCMAPIVFSWPLSSNVPRNFWWHMDTSMYPPSDRRRILSSRSLQTTQNIVVLLFWTGFTHQLGGFSLSSSRICIQLPPYPQTTTSSYFWAELCILRYIYRACPTTNDRIIAPEEERGKIWNNFWKCFLLFIDCLQFVLIYIQNYNFIFG